MEEEQPNIDREWSVLTFNIKASVNIIFNFKI